MRSPLEAVRELVQTAGWNTPSDPAAINPGDLLDDLGLDKLDRQTIAMNLEDEFWIEIGDAALERWRSVADIVTTVENACV